MKMLHPDDRPKATLRALVAYAKERDRWPDAAELRLFRRNLGSHATVHEQLARLRERGLIELVGWSAGARWIVTVDGFAVLGKPIFAPTKERSRIRMDASTVLDATQSCPNRKPLPSERALLRDIANAAIEVYS